MVGNGLREVLAVKIFEQNHLKYFRTFFIILFRLAQECD